MGNEKDELRKRFLDQVEGRAQRKFPDGRLSGDDEGELAIAVGGNPERELVLIDFGKEVTWLAFSPQDAMHLAAGLIKQARNVTKSPITLEIEGLSEMMGGE